MKIDLSLAVNDEAKLSKFSKKIQKEIKRLEDERDKSLEIATLANKNCADYKKQIITLNKTSIDLTQALKGIHLTLGAKKDLWKDDMDMDILMTTLSTFVLSSSAIKAGVVSNAKN